MRSSHHDGPREAELFQFLDATNHCDSILLSVIIMIRFIHIVLPLLGAAESQEDSPYMDTSS